MQRPQTHKELERPWRESDLSPRSTEIPKTKRNLGPKKDPTANTERPYRDPAQKQTPNPKTDLRETSSPETQVGQNSDKRPVTPTQQTQRPQILKGGEILGRGSGKSLFSAASSHLSLLSLAPLSIFGSPDVLGPQGSYVGQVQAPGGWVKGRRPKTQRCYKS